ncbi:MAG: hypothetical protein WC714_27710 [Candidatus Obscuribacterales bacterium]|jgi:hypothetical protein
MFFLLETLNNMTYKPDLTVEQLPDDASRAFLLRLFSDRSASAVRRLNGGGWRQVSRFHYVSDQEVFEALENNAINLRAVSLNELSSCLVVEIPADSRFYAADQFAQLLEILRSVSLEPRAYKAAGSDAIHLYLMLTERVSLVDACSALSKLFDRAALQLNEGDLNVFGPDQLVTLPLQAGFVWLADDLQIKVLRDEIPMESAIALFTADLSKAASPPETLMALLSATVPEVGADETPEPLHSSVPTLESEGCLDFEFETKNIAEFAKGMVVFAEADYCTPELVSDCLQEETPMFLELQETTDLSHNDLVIETDDTQSIAEITVSMAAELEHQDFFDFTPIDESARDDCGLLAIEDIQQPELLDVSDCLPVNDDFAVEKEISQGRKKLTNDAISSIETDEGTQLLLFPIASPAILQPQHSVGTAKPSHRSRGRPNS